MVSQNPSQNHALHRGRAVLVIIGLIPIVKPLRIPAMRPGKSVEVVDVLLDRVAVAQLL